MLSPAWCCILALSTALSGVPLPQLGPFNTHSENFTVGGLTAGGRQDAMIYWPLDAAEAGAAPARTDAAMFSRPETTCAAATGAWIADERRIAVRTGATAFVACLSQTKPTGVVVAAGEVGGTFAGGATGIV